MEFAELRPPDKEDAPRARHGFGGVKTRSIRNDYYLSFIVERVKLVLLNLRLKLNEPGRYTRFTKRRSLRLDRLISAIEEAHHE